jgi:hypothetical protein
MMPDRAEVVIRRSLIVPLPWRVREHPERHRTARGTLVHEALVDAAVHHLPILDTLRRIQRLERLQAALQAYAQAADLSVEVLGLEHRRDLLAADGLPMPTQLDLADVVALAQLAPDRLDALAVASAVLHVTLDLPLYATSVRASLDRIPALRPTMPWLVPSLLRWLHVRYYEALYGPFPSAEGKREVPAHQPTGVVRRREQEPDPWQVPPEWEEVAVVRAPGPRRRLADRAPSRDGQFTLLQQTRAWWAVQVEETAQREVARRWHRTQTDKAHRAKHGDDTDVADCGCFKIVRTGVREVSRLIASD